MTYKALGTVFRASILILTAFIAADMVNVFTKGALQTFPAFTAPKMIKRQQPVLPTLSQEITENENLPASDVLPPLKLIGTITGPYPFAVILDPASNKQNLYKRNDDIGNGWIIRNIEKNRIAVKKGERKELMEVKFIDAEPKGDAAGSGLKPAPAGAGIRLNAADVEGALSDLNKVMTQARVVPNLVEGKASGYRMFNIVPGSIFTKLGISNNDVVERVNGVEINSPDTMYQLFQQIKNEKKITLDLNRGGKRESVNIEIR